MSRVPLVLAIGIVLVAPFGEGGRAPQALLVLHTLAVLLVFACCLERVARGGTRLASGLPRYIVGLGAVWLLLAGASAARAAYPLAGTLGFWDLAVCAGLFLAALAMRPEARDLRRLWDAVAAATSLQALIVLARSPAGTLAAATTFLNPDHLAAFLDFGLLLAAGRAADRLERGRRRRGALWACISALHVLAVLMLQSRGALLGLGAGLLILFGARQRAWPRRARLAAGVALVVSAVLGGGLILARFTRVEDPYRYSRIGIWKATVGMIAARPLLGYGPGMFRHEGPRHNFPTSVGPFRFEKIFEGGHSALLTMTAEEGVPAALCLVAAVLSITAALVRSPWSIGGVPARALGAALAALLAQGLVEDLQERPALMLVPALLAGLALQEARRRRRVSNGAEMSAEGREAAPSPAALPPLELKGIAALGAVYLYCLAVLLPYAADREARAARRAGRAGLPLMERAARLDPWQPEYRHDLAMAVLNSGPLTPERYAQAASELLEARRLKPIDGRFPLLLGRLEALAGRVLFRDSSAPERAVRLYREAARLAPRDPRALLELAGYLADQKRDLEGLDAVLKALDLEPRFVRARILEALLLTRLGRLAEARAALGSLEQTQALLKDYRPDSGYARDLAMDAPAERERLAREMTAAGTHPGRGEVR